MEKTRGKLGGISPRARGTEKTRTVLSWLYRWGWASPTTLETVAGGGKRTNLVSRLVKNGLVESTKTLTGGGIKGVPRYIVTLTEIGLHEVEKHLGSANLIKYELDPYKVNQSNIQHDELAQRATATAQINGTIVSFQTPKEMAVQSAGGVKQPDVFWVTSEGKKLGVEVELSAKWERKLDQFVLACLQSMQKNSTLQVDHIALVSDSKAIFTRYQAAFKSGAKLPIWEKNARGFWSIKETKSVPEWAEGRLLCKLIEL